MNEKTLETIGASKHYLNNLSPLTIIRKCGNASMFKTFKLNLQLNKHYIKMKINCKSINNMQKGKNLV